MKLKLKDAAPPPAAKPARVRAAPKPPKAAAKKPGMEDERLDANVKEPPVKMRKVTFTVPDDGKIPRLALLNARHDEWLQAAGAQERRTPEQFIDRLVRLAWAKDSTKGGKFTDKTGGDGHARGRGEHGVSSSHPARGNE